MKSLIPLIIFCFLIPLSALATSPIPQEPVPAPLPRVDPVITPSTEADNPTPAPLVTCHLDYQQQNKKGVTVHSKRGEEEYLSFNEEFQEKVNGFELKALISPKWIPEGPFDGYELSLTLSKKKVSTLISDRLDPSKPYDSKFLQLNIGNESVSVSCDIEPPPEPQVCPIQPPLELLDSPK